MSEKNQNIHTYHPTSYLKPFQTLVPISIHSSFITDLQVSDKIILPKSVYYDLMRLKYPTPFVLQLVPQRHLSVSVYCSPLEFTAEEGEIYLPDWMFEELGYKVKFKKQKNIFKNEHGINLISASTKLFLNRPIYTLPICTHVTISVSIAVDEETIIQKLSNFTVLIEGKLIESLYKEEFSAFRIHKLSPGEICVNRGGYKLEIVKKFDKNYEFSYAVNDSQVMEIEENYDFDIYKKNTERNDVLDLPDRNIKLPKFIYEMMNKKKKIQIRPKNAQKKINRNSFGLESFTLLAQRRSKSHLHSRFFSDTQNEAKNRLSPDTNILKTDMSMQNGIEEELYSEGSSQILKSSIQKNVSKLSNKPTLLEISLPSIKNSAKRPVDK